MTKKCRIVCVGLVAFVLAAGATGCSSHRGAAGGAARHTEYPLWVTRGSGYFSGEAGPAFFGVGVVSGIRNMALARTTADNRARAEAAKLFEAYTVALVGAYATANSAGAPLGDSNAGATNGQDLHVETILKVFTAATLNAIQIVDHWLHPGDGGLYALARLDLQAFVENLDKMTQLTAEVRDYVRNTAVSQYGQFERAQTRYGNAAPGSPTR